MMAGWIVRVVTVTHERNYLRDTSHVRTRETEVRGPTLDDIVPPCLLPEARSSAGPCGSSTARAAAPGAIWARLIAEIEDYAARWGQNPLGAGKRISAGANLLGAAGARPGRKRAA